MNRLNKSLAATLFFLILLGSAASAPAQSATAMPARVSPEPKTAAFYRTELYFGRSNSDGTLVSDESWKKFLSEIVTPRFPDGFTELKAVGQYRTKTGRIISEPSEVLIFLYPRSKRKESRTKIEEIRAAYLKRFEQESVLRVDLPKSVRVSF